MGYIHHHELGKDRREVLETIPYDWVRFINVLPEIVKQVEAIQTYLAEGSRTPFVRPSQRLSTELQDPNEILNSLTTRLESLEKVIGAKAK